MGLKVFGLANLTRDCEIVKTQGGTTICKLGLAADFGFGENKGTNFITANLFGKRAESKLPQYLKRGTQVFVTGELQIRKYPKSDGSEGVSIEINIDELDLTRGSGNRTGGSNQSQGGSNQHGGDFGGSPQRDPFEDYDPDMNRR